MKKWNDRSDEPKESLRRALEVVSGLTVRDLAARLGVSPSLLYAYGDPLRAHSPSASRLRALARLYRHDAARLIEAAEELERTAAYERSQR
ncbi:MAG TPA: helix-turn-helix transcriptional regulator [Gemmatimonadaceae bacterium]|nr:helix-turn-helix transcriptional regulator [Gemmatimonadaceae bacterium]